jgi:uncharacterized protein YbjT (DUF2867 family)
MSKSSITILVTAATGTNGSQIVKQLSSHSDIIIKAGVRDINSENAKKLQQNASNVHLVTLTEDEKTANAAFSGVDRAVIIVPVTPDYSKISTTWLNAAKKQGVKYISYLSASGVSEQSENGPLQIGKYKYQNQKFISSNFPQYTIIQPNFFHDNVLKFHVYSIKNYGTWSDNANNGPTGFVDARDISSVFVSCVLDPEKHSKKVYTISGPAAITDTQQAEILSKEVGKPIKYVPVSDDEYKKTLITFGVPEAVATDLMILNQFRAAGYCSAVTTHVKDVTGKDPISFQQWAKDNAKSFN